MRKSVLSLFSLFALLFILTACSNKPGGSKGSGSSSNVITSSSSSSYSSTTPTYTVTYNGNGCTGGSVPVDSNKYANGQTVTVLSNSGSLINTSGLFLGWNTMTNGGGTTYIPGQTFTIGPSNMILYAVWISYFSTYNTSGNTATINGLSYAWTNAGEPGVIAIPSSINGYIITGIGTGAFSNCIELTSITIPSSVTSIGDVAFSICTILATVYENAATPPATGSQIFQSCGALTIHVPSVADKANYSSWTTSYLGCQSVTITSP